jgi:hypothetical protein
MDGRIEVEGHYFCRIEAPALGEVPWQRCEPPPQPIAMAAAAPSVLLLLALAAIAAVIAPAYLERRQRLHTEIDTLRGALD